MFKHVQYSKKTLYELRDRDGMLHAKGTHGFCLDRLDAILMSGESDRDSKGWTILPYEIESFDTNGG